MYKRQVDNLVGLKENVIIGRLIPVTQELLHKYYGEDGEGLDSSVSENDGATVAEVESDKIILSDDVLSETPEDTSAEESEDVEAELSDADDIEEPTDDEIAQVSEENLEAEEGEEEKES